MRPKVMKVLQIAVFILGIVLLLGMLWLGVRIP